MLLKFFKINNFSKTIIWIIIVLLFNVNSAKAQIAVNKTDIGNPSIPGTYSYNSGTYTISASGSGIGGNSDQFTFVNIQSSQNIEITTQVATQTGTSINPYAVSGLMVRDSLNANGANAFISVSPKNGVNFSCRLSAGANTQTTLGPTLAVPVYLRIVVSSTSVAGYQSSDGLNWQLVGSCNLSLSSGNYYSGFAVCSNSNQNIISSNFSNVHLFTNVPQVSSNMMLWLRADIGVKSNSGNVTNWLDQSPQGNNAKSLSPANSPQFAPGSVNGLPSVNFNGTSNYLSMPSGFNNFNGCSIFIVTLPFNVTTPGENLIDIGNNTNDVIAATLNSDLTPDFYIYQNPPPYQHISSPIPLSQLNFNVLEAHHDGNSTGYIYVNGQQYSASLNPPINVTRTVNCVGSTNPTSLFFNGSIAEVLVFNTYLSTSQRQNVEAYLNGKYGLNVNSLAAPQITPSSGVYTSNQTITMTNPNSVGNIYYTLDASIPNSNSKQYTLPFTLTSSALVNAKVINTNGLESQVASNAINIDPYAGNIPRSNLQLWLKSDFGILSSSNNVVEWLDLSGNNIGCSQLTTGLQPQLLRNAINGFPSVSFNGITQYLNIAGNITSTFTGATIFLVTNPYSPAASNERIFNFGNGISSNNISLIANPYESGSATFGFHIFNGTTDDALNTAGGIPLNAYNVYTLTQNNATIGGIYLNGNALTIDPLNNIPNVARYYNSLGCVLSAPNTADYIYSGAISEVLVYNTMLNSTQIANVQNYLFNKYGFTVPAPSINIANGVYYTPQTITLSSASPNAKIYYILNGQSPLTPILYTGAFVINNSTSIQTWAIAQNGSQSTKANYYIDINPSQFQVPTQNLQLWLKANIGANTNGTNNVSNWYDLSGNNNNCSANIGSQPNYLASAINNLPAIEFNGSNQYFMLPSNILSNFNGTSIFLINNPDAPTPQNERIFDFNVNNQDNISTSIANYNPSEKIADLSFNISNGSTIDSLTAPGGIWPGQFQITNFSQTGSSSAAIYNNFIQETPNPSPLNNIINTSRNLNSIGCKLANSTTPQYFYAGQIAEMLVYNSFQPSADFNAVNSYLNSKYNIIKYPPTNPPQFSLTGQTLSSPTQVSLYSTTIGNIYYTVDGSTPTTSSTLYTAPINVNQTMTIKAIVSVNGLSSPIASNSYTLNSTQWPSINSGDTTPIKLNLESPLTAIP